MSHFNSKRILDDHIQLINQIKNAHLADIEKLCELSLNSLKNGGKIIFMGNGGSAADSQHLAAEFVGRFVKERIALPSIALTTDTSILTAIGNDYSFESIFSRQIEALCNNKDIVIGISTSGNSKNIISGIYQAKLVNALTIGFLGGDGGKLKSIVDVPIVIPSKVTARIQEAHILIGHILCEYCDEYFI